MISFFFLLSWVAHGQAPERNFQSWTDLTYRHNATPNLQLGLDLGFRGIVSSVDWSQVYVRPNLNYYFTRIIAVGGGLAYFRTWNLSVADVNELRGYQNVSITWPSFNFMVVKHRIQFEQRKFYYSASNLDYDSDFTTRLRYRIKLESADIIIARQNFYFFANTEWFQTRKGVVEPFIDNLRLVAGIGHRVNRFFRYEIHYINQSSRVEKDNGLQVSAHILRVILIFMTEKKTGANNERDEQN